MKFKIKIQKVILQDCIVEVEADDLWDAIDIARRLADMNKFGDPNYRLQFNLGDYDSAYYVAEAMDDGGNEIARDSFEFPLNGLDLRLDPFDTYIDESFEAYKQRMREYEEAQFMEIASCAKPCRPNSL